jgi:glycosyltransferase involved in cell wall biosynthesis
MRLLVVGHPFLVAYNQKKYVAMKQLDRKLSLRLLVPNCGRERFNLLSCQVHPKLSLKEVVALRAILASWHMTYMHNPVAIVSALRDFKPDLIYIEEEPQALISAETIALQRIFAPDATVALFTWDNILRPRRFPLCFVKQRLRRYSLARVATVICGNRAAAELLRAEGHFRGQVEVLPQYGLDESEYQPGTEPVLRSMLGLENTLVVGYFGRLVPEKGLRQLLDALRQLRDYSWKLLLVGAGSLKAEIRERWVAEFPGRVVLVPAVPYEQVPRYLRCVDILVLPSLSTPFWKEQFGMSLAQAMMLEIPCIGSSSGAIPDVLGPGGVIAEEGNVKELTRALANLLNFSAEREQFGKSGRTFALKHYTIEGVGARYLAAFERARSRTAAMQEGFGGSTENEPVVERTCNPTESVRNCQL